MFIPLKSDKSFDIRVNYLNFSNEVVRIKFVAIGYIDAKECNIFKISFFSFFDNLFVVALLFAQLLFFIWNKFLKNKEIIFPTEELHSILIQN